MSVIGHSILGHKIYAPEGRPGPFDFVRLPLQCEAQSGVKLWKELSLASESHIRGLQLPL